MAKKRGRTCCKAVRPGLEHGDQVTDIGLGEFSCFSNDIQWRAQWANDENGFPLVPAHAIADDYRVVFADDLAKVTGCGEMVMQASIGYEKHMPARNLAIDNAADVEASLA